MTPHDDAKARIDAIRANQADWASRTAKAEVVADDLQAGFNRGVDEIFGPIFRAKAEALATPNDPVKLAPRALFYRNLTLYYKPLWNQILWEIAGRDIFEHLREKTRGNYVYLGLTAQEPYFDALGSKCSRERILASRYLRAHSNSEPRWGEVTMEESVTSLGPYEGSMREERRTYFPVTPIHETTDAIVQGLVEALVRNAG